MTSIKALYRSHFLEADLIVALILSAVLIAFRFSLFSMKEMIDWQSTTGQRIYPAIATIAGTLLGFVITGVSIIMALTESGRGALLKESPHYPQIFKVYVSAIRYLAASTALPLIGMVVEGDLGTVICSAIIASIVISSFRLWRCLWVLSNLFEISAARKG